MTLPCSAACLLCPDASREVQTTFTPKITFRVPLSPSAPSREGEGLPVTLGGVIQMVHQMCGQSTWWESGAVLRALRTAWDALVLMKCVWINECSRSALRKEARENFFLQCACFYFLLYVLVWTFVYPCSGLVASPSHPTTLLLHSWLPHPSQLPLGLPLAPLLGRAGVLGAPPPVLPGSCCPQLRSCRRYWGRTKSLLLWLCLGPSWEDEEVARRLLLPIKALLLRLSWMLEGWKYIRQA